MKVFLLVRNFAWTRNAAWFTWFARDWRNFWKVCYCQASTGDAFSRNQAWRAYANPNHVENRYFPTFIDDCTRMCWVYLLRLKSVVFCVFKKTIIKLWIGHKLKKWRTNRGGEYASPDFKRFCEDVGLKRKLTIAYSPQRNGVVENRTIVEMVKCMLHEQNMPHNLWGEVVNTAVHLLNKCLTKSLYKITPFEA